MMQALWRSILAAGSVGGALCGVAMAHHSIASFDRDNQLVVAGTVKSWHLANPHAWIFLMVPNDSGGEDEWALEGTAAAGLIRSGYTKYTLQPGEKVRVLIAPKRDGSHGGEFGRILSVNGEPMQQYRKK